MASFEKELHVARELAQQASALVLSYRDGDLRVELKGEDDPVTIADKAASELIVSGLRKHFPNDVIISEENADDLARLTANRVWYIDPIDGTKDFIRREDGFCIMIGLAVEHQPAAGVVFQPTKQRCYYGTADGSFIHDAQGSKAIRCAPTKNLHDTRLVGSKSHRNPVIERVKTAFGISNEKNVGSVGLKVGLIAEGECDLYVNISNQTYSWDTCAPQAILLGAGGRITDLGGTPLHYDVNSTNHAFGSIASNGVLHEAAVNALVPYIEELRASLHL